MGNGFRLLMCRVLPPSWCQWLDRDDCPVHNPRSETPNCPLGTGYCYVCQPDARAQTSALRTQQPLVDHMARDVFWPDVTSEQGGSVK